MAQIMPKASSARFIFSRTESIATGGPSGVPPIAQFVLHAIAWCRTKFAASASGTSPLRLVSQLALGGKRSLSLVEAGGVRFLVGGGADSVTVIVPVVPPKSVSEENAADVCARIQRMEDTQEEGILQP